MNPQLTVVGDAISEPLTSAPGDPAGGRAIVVNRQVGLCLLCHSGPFPEQRFQGDLAPDLAGIGARLSAAQIRQRVAEPGPASIMPAYYKRAILTGQQIEDVVAFLATLKEGRAAPLAAAESSGEKRSGYEDMGRETRALQDDDATNPGMFWVQEGEGLFKKDCAGCHADQLKGVAARRPALEKKINQCRVERVRAPALAYESRELLALTAYVARQSRGMPIDVKKSEAGEKLYRMRQGQLNLSCAQCHDERSSGKLAGNPITQGHATGYPIYRLEWQGMGSLQRRLRNCFIGVRAEPYAYGSNEFVELELYLMWRARGMKMETPAVRP